MDYVLYMYVPVRRVVVPSMTSLGSEKMLKKTVTHAASVHVHVYTVDICNIESKVLHELALL